MTDYNGSGVVLDSTVTTTVTTGATAPNGSPVQTVTIDRDPTGAGYTAQQEVDTTNADGSTSVSISDLTRNGTLDRPDRFDGQRQWPDPHGHHRFHTANGINDLTETDVTVINADGSRTETVTDTNSDGSMRDQTVTVTSANGLNHHNTPSTAPATASSISSPPRPSSTMPTAARPTTQTDSANNGAMLDQTVTTVSADGLTTTTQTDSTGNGAFDQTQVDQTMSTPRAIAPGPSPMPAPTARSTPSRSSSRTRMA